MAASNPFARQGLAQCFTVMQRKHALEFSLKTQEETTCEGKAQYHE